MNQKLIDILANIQCYTEELESEMGVQSLFLVTENATVSSVVATASTLGHQFIRRYNLVDLFSDHCKSPEERKEPAETWSYNWFACDVCSSQFGSQMELLQHSMTHTNGVSQNNSYDKQLKDSEEHTIIHTYEKPAVCFVCGKKFNLDSSSAIHSSSKSDARFYVCNICSKQRFKRTNSTILLGNEIPRKIQNTKQLDDADLAAIVCLEPKNFSIEANTTVTSNNLKEQKSETLEMSCQKLEITKDEGLPIKIGKNWKSPHQKLFQCNLCGKQFDRPNELKWHRRTHSRCTMCNKSFKDLYSLKKHMYMHTGEKSFVCSVCGEKFSTNRGLRFHVPTHFDTKRYMCRFCPEKFKRLDILMDHVMRHDSVPETVRSKPHPNDDRLDETVCSKFEKSSNGVCTSPTDGIDLPWQNEISLVQNNMSEKATTEIVRRTVNVRGMGEVEIGVRHYKCVLCGDLFMEIRKLEEHVLENHVQRTSNQRVQRTEDIIADGISLDSRQIGDINEKPTKTRSTTKHKRTKDQNRYRCDVCVKRFNRPSKLRWHAMSHTTETIQCSECGTQFGQPYSLKEHMKIHAGEKPFMCSVCGKLFYSNGALRNHARIHSDIRPYVCSLCPKQFRWSHSLYFHMRKHTSTAAKKKNKQKPEGKQKVVAILPEISSNGVRSKTTSTIQSKRLPKRPNEECSKEEAEQTGNETDHGNTRSREKFEHGACEARHTNGTSRYSVCDKECNQPHSLKENVNIDTGEKSFVCSICSQRFSSNASLRNHELVHSDSSPYVCSICPARFERSDKLEDHVKKHDTILARMWNERLTNEDGVLSIDVDRGIKKDDDELERKYEFQQFSSQMDSTGSIKHDPEQAENRWIENRFECDICDKKFNRPIKLKWHKKTHTERSPPAQCNVCSKRFKRPNSLKEHMNIHTGEMPFMCSVCGKRLHSNSSLKSHMYTHSDYKPYMCSLCPKQFKRSDDLKKHTDAHSLTPEQRPFVCTMCNARFLGSQTLKIHMRIHTGEKPYSCDQCGKSFTQSGTLKSHMVIHTGKKPYQCDECELRFTVSSHLTVHKRIHTGEKPYRCTVCERTFAVKTTLNKHMHVHTGVKPYACSRCNKTFKRKISADSCYNRHAIEKNII